jgi:hypothetical protein
MSFSPDWTPAACTLPTPERPVRSAEFDRLFRSLIDVDRPGPTALRLVVDGTEFPVEAVADLAARESHCCSFFTFAVAAASGAVTMDVTVADVHAEVLDALQARAQSVWGSAAS